MRSTANEYLTLHVDDTAAWRAWLEANHANVAGVWLLMAKKGSTLRSPSRSEALDVALCYGWIDGQAKRRDDDSWLQKYTPRGKRSIWSKRNREHVERLIASGAMQPPGLAAVEAAKKDGRWDRAYDSPATAAIPEDFEEALAAKPAARAFFEELKGQNRYAILHRIQTAVRAETRARRIEKFVAMLDRKETIY